MNDIIKIDDKEIGGNTIQTVNARDLWTSGFTGVCWHAPTQKWHAQICVDNRVIYLGLFENFEDAVEARKEAKMKYHPTSPEAQKYASEK